MNNIKWSNPYSKNKGLDKFIESLEKEIVSLQDKDFYRVTKVLEGLSGYVTTLPNNKKMYVNIVIHNIKKHLTTYPENTVRTPKHSHILSDHAFMRVLELVGGADVTDLKTKALDKLNTSKKWKPVYSPDLKRVVSVNERYIGDNINKIAP